MVIKLLVGPTLIQIYGRILSDIPQARHLMFGLFTHILVVPGVKWIGKCTSPIDWKKSTLFGWVKNHDLCKSLVFEFFWGC